ncbi:glycosyl transferase family 1 [candidate division LCP-89 bacterium B3_LCP]|uniref:Glycosyl transferase family 1 n=1 Tax=candidate division LCP-89 bacterium B3_LCP TaxID=2012998 RepID=A0A532V3W0_UNCL8|nr:MAG: glycosyl transferase family 1 [candidate division LCP-89 bacterium B3_LCP]
MSIGDFQIALVHDWLTGMRGGEKCLEVLCEFFPEATLFTIYHDHGAMSPIIEGMKIRTSWIERLPFARPYFRAYLPFFPAAIENFDLSAYQLIISTSHCVAKGVKTPHGSLHLSYIHTPMRYIWEMYRHYLGSARNPLKRLFGPVLASRLRTWDVASSDRVDEFIANSENVRKRIGKHYSRDATVIHPPVDTDFYHPTENQGDYYLIVTALVPYKAVDIAVHAFNSLGRKLIIVGDGPECNHLKQIANANIEFLPWQNEESLRNLYSGCQALIFPGEEDFGIVPLEAQSCGRPVVAYGRGGVLETVIPLNQQSRTADKEPTGVFFHHPNSESLAEAVRELDGFDFKTEAIRRHALQFRRSVFVRKMADFINASLRKKFGNSEDIPFIKLTDE